MKNNDNKKNRAPYNISKDLFEKTHFKYHKKVFFKRVLIVSVVICLCLIALATAKLLGSQSFNMLGEKTGSSYPTLDIGLLFKDHEGIEYNRQFLEEKAEDEVRIIGRSSSSSGIKTDDYYKITDIMIYNKSPLRLPTYIPEGYSFTGGSIDFYIDKDNLPKLISSENINGQMYYIYKFRKGYKENVSGMKLSYANKKGDIIICSASLSGASVDNFDHSVANSAVVESLEIASYDSGIWIYDKKNKYFLNSIALLKYIPHISTVDLMDTTYTSMDTSIQPTSTPEQEMKNGANVFTSISYHISSDVLGVEELIKIAESLN